MTNKKLVVFDENLVMVDAEYRTFELMDWPSAQDVDSVPVHDLASMERWLLEGLSRFAARYPVRAISVTTHGATCVAVGDDGLPAVPAVVYTHEPGDRFHDRFFDMAGNPYALQQSTGTPYFRALVNTAKGTMFARERFPEAWKRVRYVLGYPQYWSYRLTGIAATESTYIGSHSYFWNHTEKAFSGVVGNLGLEGLMPTPVRMPCEVLGTVLPEVARKTGLDSNVIVTTGIHDSNAALLPYLACKPDRDFVLDSTGTWCVLMHPGQEYGFRADDIGRIVFFNQAADGKPVKTAIFTGGLEYGLWNTLIDRNAGCSADDSTATGTGSGPIPCSGSGHESMIDYELYRRIVKQRELFLLPEILQGSGQFPDSTARLVVDGTSYSYNDLLDGADAPSLMNDAHGARMARAALNLSLAIQTSVALGRIGSGTETDIYIEGGFRNNPDYSSLVATLAGGARVWLTGFDEATSLGAAMTARIAMTGEKPADLGPLLSMEQHAVAPMELDGLPEYRNDFMRHAEGRA